MTGRTNGQNQASTLETITFGGGCFWCLDPIFRDLIGVEDVTVGYAGGETPDPSYELVCTGTTGHAEVLQVQFDTEQISLEQIFTLFFTFHDPTTLNRQGADVGPQYRSIILYRDEQQKAMAERVIARLQEEGLWEKPFVTELVPLETFYEAEAYHQRYFERNPTQGYCQVVIAPKVAKFRAKYVDQIKSS